MSDDSELRAFAVVLDEASEHALEGGRALVQVEALASKRDWQARWTGITGMPAIAAAITYDTKLVPGGAEAEIGPDKDRPQGPLGNIVEYGGSTHGPIRPAGAQVLTAATSRLMDLLGDVGERAL